MRKGKLYIGTSGFSNGYWRGHLYPEEMKSADFLSFYATVFNATEINSTFYHTPRHSTVLHWINQVPGAFRFCIKMNRFITHMKKLNNAEEAIERFIDSIEPLKKLMGPALIQLPASLKYEPEKTEIFFRSLMAYPGYLFAVEARHPSWFAENPLHLMRQYNITWVIAESGMRFPYAEHVTSNHVYLRFHGPQKLYDSSYTSQAMEAYSIKIKDWLAQGLNVWVFFNNTMHLHALANADMLKHYLEKLPVA